jgi:uncharacterized membrane protein HdeD (DUF308 family)
MAEAVLKRATGWSIVLGILMIIAGFVAMIAPFKATLFLTIVIGWSAIFNGLAQIVYAFRTHGGWHVLLEVLLGILYVVAGGLILWHPFMSAIALTLFVGWLLVIYGIFALLLAFRIRPRSGWGWVLFDGVVTILLGILICVHWPHNVDWVVGTLFGISIFMSGITRLMMSLALRKVASAT